MRKYKGYDDYKDSGVEWIGEIPEHWLTAALKRLFKIVNGGTPKSNEPLFWDDGNVIWATPEDLSKNGSKYIEQSKRKISLQGVLNSSATVVPVNSLIISTRAPIGYIKTAAVSLSVNQGCKCLVRRNTLNEEFYYYFLLTAREELIALGQGSTFMELSNFNLANTNIVVVPLEEQKQISSYLNIKTSEIDALITNKEKLIELLKEQRQTIITEAVTKGLNPDAKMKDSGVEWIGEIPEHWMTIRLKYKAQLIIRKATESESELIYIGLENIEPKTGRLIGDMEQIIDGDALLFERSQVLFNKLRPYLSKCFLATCNGRCSSELFVLNAKSILPKFLYYTMLADLFIQTVNSSTYGVKMPRANWTFVGDVRITVPSSSEQQTIAAFLDHKTSEIDALITKERTQIEKLKSYRQSLIFEAVTGKIDVRDWSDKPLERSEAVANA